LRGDAPRFAAMENSTVELHWLHNADTVGSTGSGRLVNGRFPAN
jgi:hypothetical protein